MPAVLLLLAGGGAAAYASSTSAPVGYRTSAIVTGDVNQLLTGTGTIAVVDQVRARFRTSGTVATVAVAIGDKVTAGQALATLETAPLDDAITQATATLTKAQATLETDQAAATATTTASTAASAVSAVSASAASPSASNTPSTGGRGVGSGTGSSSGSGDSLATAQQNAARTLGAATDALAAAEQACAGGGAASPSSEASPSSAASPSRFAAPSREASPGRSASLAASGQPGSAGGSSSDTSCSAALQRSLKSQQQAATAAQHLLQVLRAAVTSTATTTVPGTAQPRSGTTKTTAANTAATSSATTAADQGNQGNQGGGMQSVASRITTDTAAVSAAQTGLTTAQADLAGATLTSPIAGTVSVLPYTAGSTASTNQAITVLGPGAATVTLAIPATTLGKLAVGQLAVVTADSAAAPVAGSVTAIALLATTSAASSTPTYAVTVLVPQAGKAFVNGSSAAVSITIKTVKSVLTVVNSALSNGFVSVLTGTNVVRTRVTTGAAGALVTQITSGLTAGQLVVLADLTKVLPANSTTTIRGLNSGAGSGGGPGGGPGGRPGG